MNFLVRAGRNIVALVGAALRFDCRPALVAWAYWCVKVHGTFTYSEDEDRWSWVESVGKRIADCSAWVTGVFRRAGGRDPNHNGWSFGDTETIFAQVRAGYGRVCSEGRAIGGDACLFGAELPLADQHIALVVKGGRRPIVIGHGEPGCPCLGPADLDSRSRTYLQIPTRTNTRVTYPPKVA